MNRCEDCRFIRLALVNSEHREQLLFAKCKASKNKGRGRISQMFQNEELNCSVMREGESDDCSLFCEKKEAK